MIILFIITIITIIPPTHSGSVSQFMHSILYKVCVGMGGGGRLGECMFDIIII